MEGYTIRADNKIYDLHEAVKWARRGQGRLLIQLVDACLAAHAFHLKKVFGDCIFSVHVGCPDIVGRQKLSSNTRLLVLSDRTICRECSGRLLEDGLLFWVSARVALSQTVEAEVRRFVEAAIRIPVKILVEPKYEAALKKLLSDEPKVQIVCDGVDDDNFGPDLYIGECVPLRALFRSDFVAINPCDAALKALAAEQQWNRRYSRVEWAKNANRIVLLSRTAAMAVKEEYVALEKSIRVLIKRLQNKQLFVVHSCKTSITTLLDNFHLEADLFVLLFCAAEFQEMTKDQRYLKIASCYELLVALADELDIEVTGLRWAIDPYVFDMHALAVIAQECCSALERKQSNSCQDMVPFLDSLRHLQLIRSWSGLQPKQENTCPTLQIGRTGLACAYDGEIANN